MLLAKKTTGIKSVSMHDIAFSHITLIADLIEQLLAVLKRLDDQKKPLHVFVVYAYENPYIPRPTGTDIACHWIKWLRQVGIPTLPDSWMVNYPVHREAPSTVEHMHPILTSQLWFAFLQSIGPTPC